MLKAYKTFLLSIILLPLQIFSASISGQLDNGFQYVIEEKQNVKEQVAIRLVVKVGSIYEEEEEKGIAHFVEHMLFKGTESFPNFQAIQELASLGAEFGRQVNATTKMDHTEFVIDLPLYKKKALERALRITSEWAFKASFKDEAIDLERDVILDEAQRRDSKALREHRHHWDSIHDDPRLQDRHPIGSEEVIKNAPKEVIRNFYKKHYLPQAMRLIVSGDLQAEQVQEIIERFFSEKKEGEITALPQYEIPNFTTRVRLIEEENKANGSTIISFSSKPQNIDPIYYDILKYCLDKRLQKMAEEKNSPIYSGSVELQQALFFWHNTYIRTKSASEDLEESIFLLSKEIQRIKKFGFLASELQDAQVNLEDKLVQDKKQSESLEYYKKQFLYSVPFKSFESSLDESIKKLQSLNYSTFTQFVKALFSQSVVQAFAPVGSTSEQELKEAFHQGIFANVKPWTEERKNTSAPTSFDSHLISEKDYPVTKVTKLQFENGLTVLLKENDSENNEVLVQGHASGGITRLNEEHLLAGNLAKSLGSFPLFKSPNSELYTNIYAYSRKIEGRTKADEIALLLHSLAELFQQKSSPASFQFKLSKLKAYATNPKSKRSDFRFASYFAMSNEHNYYKPIKTTDINAEEIYLARNFYQAAYSKISDFTLCIAGNFNRETVKNQLIETLGQVKNGKGLKPYTHPLKMAFPQGIQKGSIQHDFENVTVIQIPLRITEGRYKSHRLQAAVSILRKKLMDKLRREKGLTYTITAQVENPYFKKGLQFLRIEFSSVSENKESIVYDTLSALYEFKISGASTQDIENLKLQQKMIVEKNKTSNSYWTSTLLKREALGLPLYTVGSVDQVIDSLNSEEIQEVVDQIFPLKEYTVLHSKPPVKQ